MFSKRGVGRCHTATPRGFAKLAICSVYLTQERVSYGVSSLFVMSYQVCVPAAVV